MSVHPKTGSTEKATNNASPPGPEKINSDKHPSFTSPSKSTRVPAPAGITAPVKENASPKKE